jgi:hypothetical protein
MIEKHGRTRSEPPACKGREPFRLVRTAGPFIEESWLGRLIRIGTGRDAVHAVFGRVVERCIMVGMRQPGLAGSGTVLKRLAQREDNLLRVAIGGGITCPGTVRLGAPILPSVQTFLSVDSLDWPYC